MIVVAGLSLKNLHPRVWDAASPFFLPDLKGVMISYAEFHKRPRQRERAMTVGLRTYLGLPDHVRVYLDNGAFFFLGRDGDTAHDEYAEFVAQARPDWYPIPRDHIPSPKMTLDEQRDCLSRTMLVNGAFVHDGFVPVVHISQVIDEYVEALLAEPKLAAKPVVAFGGIVPNLLRMPKARPYHEVLDAVRRARMALVGKDIHLFGVGGTATLHLATLLEINSTDSSGWRNRAARGIVQLPGTGDRLVADLGKWRGREPSEDEWRLLDACPCPACRLGGLDGLKASGRTGFDHRATHNLWVLLREESEVETRLAERTYTSWYANHLDNSIYLPLVRQVVEWRFRFDSE